MKIKGLQSIALFIFLVSFVLLLVSYNIGYGTDSTSPTGKKETISIIDMAGRVVVVPSKVSRIIGAGPGSLRLLCYMGLQKKIVGIEQSEKNWGPSGRPYVLANPGLLALPSIGAGGPASINSGPDPELVLSLNPDVIFITYMNGKKADEYQKKVGIPVVLLSYGKLATFDRDVYESLKIIGRIVESEARAQKVIDYIKNAERDLKARTGDVPEDKRPTVYVGGIGYKGIHGIESTSANYPPFDAVNAKNVADSTGKSGHLFVDKEQILKWDPDYIFIDEGGYRLVERDLSDPLFRSLKAVREKRVFGILPYNFYTTNIGTAIADAYFIGKVIYPEKFRDVDAAKKADEIYEFLVGKPVYKEMKRDFGGFKRLD